MQIRNVLTEASAQSLRTLLMDRIPWGLSWQAGPDGPHHWRSQDLAKSERLQEVGCQVAAAAAADAYAFRFASYPMVQAYLERWDPGSPMERLLEAINSRSFMNFMRQVTGEEQIVKADAQATWYQAGDFLAVHDDSEEARGRRIAYVLNLTAGPWRPEWGGQLTFVDDNGNVVQAFTPRFNSLNLFRVPQLHAVTQVNSFVAAGHRFAITGWGRTHRRVAS